MTIPLDAKIAFFLAFSGYLYYLYYVISNKQVINIIGILPGIFTLFGIIINYTIGLSRFYNICESVLYIIFLPLRPFFNYIELKMPKCPVCGDLEAYHLIINYNDAHKGNKEN